MISTLKYLPDGIKDKFKAFALDNKDIESCGLIGCNSDFFLHRCNNISREPNKYFEISSRDYLAASRRGELCAIIHSHIQNKPLKFSILDKTIAQEHEITSIIYDIHSDTFNEYIPDGYKNIYLDRIFKWGESDCFTLVADYYREELGFTIPEPLVDRHNTKEYLSYLKNKQYVEHAKNNNLLINTDKEFLENDILFLNSSECSKYPSHLAIYLGANKILHQPNNSVSKIETLSEDIIDRVQCVFRRKNEPN